MNSKMILSIFPLDPRKKWLTRSGLRVPDNLDDKFDVLTKERGYVPVLLNVRRTP